jgi:hypothetical protein
VAGGEADLAWSIIGNASSCGLPKSFWSCALAVATCIGSQSTHPRLQGKSPLHVVSSHKPWIGHLRPLSCVAFAHVDESLFQSQQGSSRPSGSIASGRLTQTCAGTRTSTRATSSPHLDAFALTSTTTSRRESQPHFEQLGLTSYALLARHRRCHHHSHRHRQSKART